MEYNVFESLEVSLMSLWVEVMQYLPQLVIALLVLVVGWIIGGLLGGMVKRAFAVLKINEALDKAGVDTLSEKAGVAFKPGQFAGSLVKWFIILAFAVVSFDILGLQEVTTFMREVVLGYLPQVFAAILILFAAVVVARIAGEAVVAALRASNVHKPELFGKLTRWLIIGFGIMATLNQLQIAAELINTLFMGIVFALSLGAGLAFGLGGKNAAGEFIEKLTKK